MAPSIDISRAEQRTTDSTMFTGEMLAVAGALDVAYGLAGIVGARTVALSGAEGTSVDLAVWGWVPLAIGLALLLISRWPLTGRRWSPTPAICLLVAGALVHVALIHAFPFWTLLMIMLDLVILDQLTTRWNGN